MIYYTHKEKGEKKMKFFESGAGYLVLVLLIIAQCVIRVSYVGGQFLYLAANFLAVSRAFVLCRPKADKVKDVACTAITIGLLGLYFLG